jgi:type IV secretory pathway TrbL component
LVIVLSVLLLLVIVLSVLLLLVIVLSGQHEPSKSRG